MGANQAANAFAGRRKKGIAGADFRAMRKLAGWSQQELAVRAGTHRQTVRYWERARAVTGWAASRYFEAFAAVGITPQSLLAVPAPSAPKRCGATTRKGTPCLVTPIQGKCRCKFHGGLSTGPKSPEGRERIAEAQRARWQILRCRKAIEESRQLRARLQAVMSL